MFVEFLMILDWVFDDVVRDYNKVPLSPLAD